jgi:glycerophosphoryl diester phosphodiesterase
VALNIQERHITQALVAAIQTKGYRVAAYTVNDPARARELFDWGIDALFTDELGRIGPTA